MPFSPACPSRRPLTPRSFFLQLAAERSTTICLQAAPAQDGRVLPTKMKVFLVHDHDGRPKHTISFVEHVPDSVAKILDSSGSEDLLGGGSGGHSATCQ